jgi:hypothetical protein
MGIWARPGRGKGRGRLRKRAKIDYEESLGFQEDPDDLDFEMDEAMTMSDI